jgi:hypothetical protein
MHDNSVISAHEKKETERLDKIKDLLVDIDKLKYEDTKQYKQIERERLNFEKMMVGM